MKTTSVHQPVSPGNPDDKVGFRVGPVEVDPISGRISGPAGEQKLDPKVMAVLLRLARGGGRAVRREDLMNDVWGDVVVTDFALSRCIYQLRKALAAVARIDKPSIETLPKRGYRLIWPAHEDNQVRARSDSGYMVAGIVAIFYLIGMSLWTGLNLSPGDQGFSPGDELRLVVYPFDDLSDGQGQQPLGEGLGREIKHRLAAIPGLKLIGRTSAFDSQLQGNGALSHSERLGASYMLAGSLETVGQARRVLIDLHTVPAGELLWSREFLLERDAPFDLVRQVANEIVTRFRFSTDTRYASLSTTNLEAFESYLSASEATSYELRRQALLHAVEIDPGFSQAWNALAAIEVYPVWNGEKTVNDAWAIARPFIDKALEINPYSPDVYITLGRFRREFGELDGAIEQFEKALELDPGNPLALANLGIVLRPAGQYERALQVHRMAVALDPLDALAQARLGTSHWLMEHHEEAARHYEIAVTLKPDDEEIYDSWSAMLSLGLGQFEEALIQLDRKMLVEGRPTPRTLTRAGEVASVLGLAEMAEQYFDEASEVSPPGQSATTELAAHYLRLGDDTTAKSLARQALETSPGDIVALLLMGVFDIESGRPELFLARVESAFPELINPVEPVEGGIGEILLVASAWSANGEQEIVDRLAQFVIDRTGRPRSYQHLWVAAAYAMMGETARALRELNASPPGWVRQRAAILARDPRFAALADLPAFQQLVESHLLELGLQRDAYLNRSVARTPLVSY
jgi:tetratricopeptide (TPR) repeat protein/DNA-binding winged helix-turn-helix (wHTH) protein